jgi:hypothetical protein
MLLCWCVELRQISILAAMVSCCDYVIAAAALAQLTFDAALPAALYCVRVPRAITGGVCKETAL